MMTNEKILNEVIEKVTSHVVSDIKETINRTIEKEITKSLSRTLVEGEFYKHINDELQDGLRTIYKEIAATEQESMERTVSMDKQETEHLFDETSDQLDQIVQATEKATVDIMEVIEKHLDLQGPAREKLQALKRKGLDNAGIDQLLEMNTELNDDLMKVMTTLSFQDITGQRIKRVINALRKVEKTVFDLYLSTGLQIRAREQEPDKDLAQLEKEAQEKVTDLKGPKADANQSDVDDLLAQLGIGG